MRYDIVIEAAGQAGVKPPPLPPFRAPDQVRANVFGVQLTVAAHQAGVPASIVSARSTQADGAYASVVVRNHTTTPIRSVVIAAVVRPVREGGPAQMFTSPQLVTWIGAGENQTLEPRLIDPATVKELGSRGPEGARAVASLARVEFSDGTVWTPAEPRLPPGASAQAQAPVAPVPQTTDEFGAGAYRPGAGIANPKVISQVQPKYTREAMQAKIQGIVQVEAIVGPDGTVGDVRVLRSLDRDLGLDHEALAAARQWRFQPAMRDGKPVPIIVIIELQFKLH
jgi:TonB family protein